MSRFTTALSGLILALSLSIAAQGTTATAAADLKEVQAYTLTEPAMKRFVAATRGIMAAMKSDPRFTQIEKLKAEMKALGEKDAPTEAELQRMKLLSTQLKTAEAARPGLGVAPNSSLSDMTTAIQKEPIAVNALKGAGLTPREYAKFILAFFQASMIQGMQKSGFVKELPKEANLENLKFIEQHQAEIAALMKEFSALGRP